MSHWLPAPPPSNPRNRTVAVAVAMCVSIGYLAVRGASAQPATASFAGTLIDAVGKILPGTTVTLTNSQTKDSREVTSDASAHFSVAGLAAGDYTLSLKKPGFATEQGRVTLDAGQALVRDVALQLGTLHETIRVTGVPPAPRPPRPDRPAAPTEVDRCAGVTVGGCLVPPLKLVDVRPVFPQKLLEAGTQGMVEVDARLGTDGFLKDFRLTAPANGEFVSSTIEALKKWRFSQTKLDGVPVEVDMHVTVSFMPQPMH